MVFRMYLHFRETIKGLNQKPKLYDCRETLLKIPWWEWNWIKVSICDFVCWWYRIKLFIWAFGLVLNWKS